MALRTRYAGSGLGLKPIAIGDDPYQADTEFDSTVRIPVRAARAPSITARPPAAAAGITAPPQPQQPQIPPPVPQPPVQPPIIGQPPPTQPGIVGSSLPTTYDPNRLNFEGTTGESLLGETPRTLPPTRRSASDYSTEELARIKAAFKLDTNQALNLLDAAEANDYRVIDSHLYGESDSAQWREVQKALFDDFMLQFGGLAKGTQSVNPDFKINFLGQEAYNRGLERLKLAGAQGSREEEEEALASLASRGLLNSGIASRELNRLRESRLSNLYNAASELNQRLLSGEIGRLTERDMAQLVADLQRRNQESLARLQSSLERANQPDPLAQLLGTGLGVGLSFLPGLGGGAPTNRLYGEEDPGYRLA